MNRLVCRSALSAVSHASFVAQGMGNRTPRCHCRLPRQKMTPHISQCVPWNDVWVGGEQVGVFRLAITRSAFTYDRVSAGPRGLHSPETPAPALASDVLSSESNSIVSSTALALERCDARRFLCLPVGVAALDVDARPRAGGGGISLPPSESGAACPLLSSSLPLAPPLPVLSSSSSSSTSDFSRSA